MGGRREAGASLELGPRRKGSKAVRKRSHERSKVSVLVASEKRDIEEGGGKKTKRGRKASKLTFLDPHDSLDRVGQQHEDRSHREDLDSTSGHVEHEGLHG